MGKHEQDFLEGTLEVMAIAGQDFWFGDLPFRALVKDLPSLENESYDLSPNDDDEVTVTALRSEFPTIPRVGESFEDANGTRYRIKALRRPPNHVTIRFHCQVTYP